MGSGRSQSCSFLGGSCLSSNTLLLLVSCCRYPTCGMFHLHLQGWRNVWQARTRKRNRAFHSKTCGCPERFGREPDCLRFETHRHCHLLGCHIYLGRQGEWRNRPRRYRRSPIHAQADTALSGQTNRPAISLRFSHGMLDGGRRVVHVGRREIRKAWARRRTELLRAATCRNSGRKKTAPAFLRRLSHSSRHGRRSLVHLWRRRAWSAGAQ
mmetsp:Transcript_8791/g.26069  ORF Transcript_8791/g.26069 Transcript_8791/m.26069 type:complete len:211 (+) Transcript_8791:1095-1727(+)